MTNKLLTRLTCLTKGHDPMFTIHSSTTLTIETYVTACARCGTTYELTPTPLGVF